MGSRTVTGTIYHAGTNLPYVGCSVQFRLRTEFVSGGRLYPIDTTIAVTDANGIFVTTLAAPDTGTVSYQVIYPDHNSTVNISDGPAITLDALVTLVTLNVAPSALQTILDSALLTISRYAIAQMVYNVKDYGAVGDGVTDDTAAIQAAINAASAGTGNVFIPAGVFVVAGYLSVSSAITITGTGSQSVLKRGDGKNGTGGMALLLAHDTSHITMRDFAVDGNRTNQNSLLGLNYQQVNIRTENASDIVIDAITSYSAIYGGILCSTSQNVMITNCVVYDCVDVDTPANPIGIATDLSSFISITNCVVRDNGNSGVVLSQSHDVVAANNMVYGNVGQGFEIFVSGNQYSYHNTLQGNRVMGNGQTGISVFAGIGAHLTPYDIAIVGNSISQNVKQGINCQCIYSAITGNTIASNGFSGIYVNSATDITIDNNIIDSNNVSNTADLSGIDFSLSTTNAHTFIGSGNVIKNGSRVISGRHAGASGVGVLVTNGLAAGRLVGLTITNVTDGSTGTITANTSSTVTATLSGGILNTWTIGDEFNVTLVGHQKYAIRIPGVLTTNCYIANGNIVDGGETGIISDAGSNTVIEGRHKIWVSPGDLIPTATTLIQIGSTYYYAQTVTTPDSAFYFRVPMVLANIFTRIYITSINIYYRINHQATTAQIATWALRWNDLAVGIINSITGVGTLPGAEGDYTLTYTGAPYVKGMIPAGVPFFEIVPSGESAPGSVLIGGILIEYFDFTLQGAKN